MALAIVLIVLFVLAVLLLLPVRVKGSYGQGAWSFAVYYAFIRIIHKESEPPKEPDVPPKPGEDGEPYFASPEAEKPEADKPKPKPKPEHPKPKPKTEHPKPKPEQASAAETVTLHKPEPPAEESAPEPADSKPEKPAETESAAAEEDIPDEKPKKPQKPPKPPKKRRGIRAFIERVKPHSVSDWIGLAKDGLAALTPALQFLTRHLHFRHVKLYIAAAADDPADTAQLYGKFCAAVYNLLGQLQCWVDFEADEVRILADFYGCKTDLRASGELRVSPAAAIMLVLILGCKFLWRTICRFRREDKEAKRYEKESAPLPET